MKNKLLIVSAMLLVLVASAFATPCASTDCMEKKMTCEEAIKAGKLTGSIVSGKAVVTNNAKEAYDVGLAVYQVFDSADHTTDMNHQELFDSATGLVASKGTLNLEVDLPECQYQIDLFCGPVIKQFDTAQGIVYGNKKISYYHKTTGSFCSKEYCGDGIVNGAEQCENNAQCDDSNPFTADTCKANCACENIQTCTGCECTNSCDPCLTNPDSCHGVPEFSPVTLGVAVVLAGLGLAYFRKQ